MLASLAATQIVIDAGWLLMIAAAIPVAIYIWRRRASQSCTVTESRILTEKSVKNIEEQWTKIDDVKDRIHANAVDIAYLKGVHDTEQRLQPRPPAE